MSAPSKRRVVEDDMKKLENQEESDNEGSGSDMEGEDDDEDMENIEDQTIQVDFEAQAPEDSDFHGIRKLLSQVFLKANVDVSELSDTIISQNYVGSVLKQCADPMEVDEDSSDDDDEVLGLLTVINITERQDLPCIKQVKAYLAEKCSKCSPKQKEQFVKLLNDHEKHVGWLLSERFINMPPHIALPSYESLWKEVEIANQKKMKYKFAYYMLVSKTYHPPSSAVTSSKEDAITWLNAEEEFLLKESCLTFEYSVESERDTGVGGEWDDEEQQMVPYRTVMVIPADRMPAIMEVFRDNLALT